MKDHDLQFVAMFGSLRRQSHTRAIAQTLDELAPDDVSVEVLTGLGDLPLYNQDLEDVGVPEAVAALASRIAGADALVIVTPEYNHSLPGVLKNALDWLSRSAGRPLDRKPVAIQSASPGMVGGARAHEHLRLVLAAMNSAVLDRPQVIVGRVGDQIDADAGLLRDRDTREHVSRQLAALADMVRRSRPQSA